MQARTAESRTPPPTDRPGDEASPARPKSRRFWLIAAAPLVVVGAIGLLHLPAARPLLALLGGSGGGGCPVAVGRASPEEIERARGASLAPLKGGERAAARTALRFTLMTSTKADVQAWAGGAGLTCKEEMKGTSLRCGRVPADAAGAASTGIAISDLLFRLDEHGVLVAADVMHDGTTGDAALTDMNAAAEKLRAAFGPPSSDSGRDIATLNESYGRAAVEYRFRDFAIDLTATRFGADKVVLREQYRAIPD